MKKFVSLLLTLMMALGMTALAEESKDQLARIQEKGEIVIATEGTWAPWTALTWKLRRRLRRSWA